MAVSMVSETDHGPDHQRLRLVGPATPMDPTSSYEVKTPGADPRQQPAPAPTPPPRPVFPAAEVMQVIEALLKITSLRLLLFAAFAVTSWLGYLTVIAPTPTKITAFCLWALMAFLPLVGLVGRKG